MKPPAGNKNPIINNWTTSQAKINSSAAPVSTPIGGSPSLDPPAGHHNNEVIGNWGAAKRQADSRATPVPIPRQELPPFKFPAFPAKFPVFGDAPTLAEVLPLREEAQALAFQLSSIRVTNLKEAQPTSATKPKVSLHEIIFSTKANYSKEPETAVSPPQDVNYMTSPPYQSSPPALAPVNEILPLRMPLNMPSPSLVMAIPLPPVPRYSPGGTRLDDKFVSYEESSAEPEWRFSPPRAEHQMQVAPDPVTAAHLGSPRPTRRKAVSRKRTSTQSDSMMQVSTRPMRTQSDPMRQITTQPARSPLASHRPGHSQPARSQPNALLQTVSGGHHAQPARGQPQGQQSSRNPPAPEEGYQTSYSSNYGASNFHSTPAGQSYNQSGGGVFGSFSFSNSNQSPNQPSAMTMAQLFEQYQQAPYPNAISTHPIAVNNHLVIATAHGQQYGYNTALAPAPFYHPETNEYFHPRYARARDMLVQRYMHEFSGYTPTLIGVQMVIRCVDADIATYLQNNAGRDVRTEEVVSFWDAHLTCIAEGQMRYHHQGF